MHRLFTAIDLPGDIKDQLTPLLSGLPGAKWVSRPQLHLTLRFIGEVETAAFKAIADALQGVQGEPFDMRLNGVGRFPPKGPARIIWVGAEEHPALLNLQKQVEKTVTALGYPPEDRPFSAHITLARLKTPPPRETVETYLSKHNTFKTPSFPIMSFVLFSSVLSPQGPTYRAERVYRLDSRA